MKKLSQGDADLVDGASPADQSVLAGSRLKEVSDSGVFQIVTTIAAGSVGVITPANLPSDPRMLFDFEILDVTVRTESAVSSSTIQVKNGTTAVTDAIVSAVNKATTRAGSIDPAQNQFFPLSNPSGYASSKCNLVDAGGATAAARTVILWVRKL